MNKYFEWFLSRNGLFNVKIPRVVYFNMIFYFINPLFIPDIKVFET
jgi:hypothetical protein